MPTIAEIFVYPVKSCAAVSLDEVQLVPTGFEYDRNWMIVDKNGHFVTQREHPELALVRPSVENGALTLEAPSMPMITVPVDKSDRTEVTIFGECFPAYSCAPEANRWFSGYLKGDFKLVRDDPDVSRPGGVQYPTRDSSPTRFVDNYGVLVISQASHEALNERLPAPIPLNRFRPNLVLSGVEEHDEDYITTARRDDVVLRFVNPCFRCNMTSISQETGEKSLDPLPVLATYRFDEAFNGVKFGAYASVIAGFGRTLGRGNKLEVEWSF
jgi:uncharacterized protein YcbX